MTESDQQAQQELALLKRVKNNSDDYPSLAFERLAKPASKFVDKDGNNINDFYLTNAKDNYKITLRHDNNMTNRDLHNIIDDTMRAINGDTNTLLHE